MHTGAHPRAGWRGHERRQEVTATNTVPRRRLSDWLAWQERLHPSAIELGLERVRATLARLQWRRPACPILTVAGTNGKGSIVALTSCILREAGYRVATFTSPHLLRYNERIVIDGRAVCDASLIAAFERIEAARGTDTLTFFEFSTLAALLVFETARPDAIVLEVGLGGRLDAVNVVDADLAVITSIALDHCDWLGADREQIGREKAGILRAARPAFFGSRDMPASVGQIADQLGVDLQRLGRDFEWTARAARWDWRGRRGQQLDLPPPALAGTVQYDNAATVLGVLESLEKRLPVGREAIERGLRAVRLPGRFQRFREPLSAASGPDAIEWILDVAHNPAAARTLAEQLEATRAGVEGHAAPAGAQHIAVCGILGDKDVEGIVGALQGCFDAWVIVGLPGPRALDPQTLAQRVRALGAQEVEVAGEVIEGCAAARARARAGDRIVVFGSFLTVAPALEWLLAHGLSSS